MEKKEEKKRPLSSKRTEIKNKNIGKIKDTTEERSVRQKKIDEKLILRPS